MPEARASRAGRLGLALLLAAGCGAQDEHGAEAELRANPLVARTPSAPRALDPLGQFKPAAPLAPDEPALPELAFQECSDGLPPSGSWSGRPLLAELGAGPRSALVVSNCEEEGYRLFAPADPPSQSWVRTETKLEPGLGCGATAAADFDGDGHLDLALTSTTNGVRLFFGNGAFGWRPPAERLADTPVVADLAVGDLDGDGRPDLAGIGFPRGGLVLLLGGGPQGLRPAGVPGPLAPEEYGRDLEIADLDLDGRADFAVASGSGVRAFLRAPGAELRWQEASRGLPAPSRPDAVLSVCTGRFTADPRPQIACCSAADPRSRPEERDTIGVFGWNESKQAWEHIDSGLPRSDRYSDLRAADFDGDGQLDLVTLSLEHGAAIYLGDGHGTFRARGRLPGVHGHGRITVGSIDHGGRPDLALSVSAEKDHPDAGGVRVFLNRPQAWQPPR